MQQSTNIAAGRTALFPGSFDPFTIGHASIVDRGLQIFDRIVVAVGISIAKHTPDEVESRLAPIRRLYADNPRVEVVSYEGLTVDAVKQFGADIILRGVRDLTDFDYERNMADVNRRLTGVETLFMPTLPELATVRSSIVRELQHFGRDVSDMLP